MFLLVTYLHRKNKKYFFCFTLKSSRSSNKLKITASKYSKFNFLSQTWFNATVRNLNLCEDLRKKKNLSKT